MVIINIEAAAKHICGIWTTGGMQFFEFLYGKHLPLTVVHRGPRKLAVEKPAKLTPRQEVIWCQGDRKHQLASDSKNQYSNS
jgi:hypothetical protein